MVRSGDTMVPNGAKMVLSGDKMRTWHDVWYENGTTYGERMTSHKVRT